MERKDMVKQLQDLIQLDIDAWFAYGQAIEEIKEPQIKEQLQKFRGDHERHAKTLSAKLQGMGGTAPEFRRDFKGFLIEGFTAVRSMTGTKGALNAMETNEKLTNRNYEKQAGMDYPPDLKPLIKEFLGDEQKHLKYVQEMLQLLKAERPAELQAGEKEEKPERPTPRGEEPHRRI